VNWGGRDGAAWRATLEVVTGRTTARAAAVVAAFVAVVFVIATSVASADPLPPAADADATPGSSRPTAPSVVGAGSATGASRHGAPAVEPIALASLDLFDGSRFTPPRGGVPGHLGRSLPTAVWYPTTPGPWPLVVFAHGFNVTPATYSALLGSIASAGYVVAAPYLPGERSDVAGPPTQGDIPNEPGDLSFVISSVVAATGDPSSFLFGRVDPSRIGAAGHSDGGIVAAALATNSATVDFRVRATAVLSGGFWPIPGGVWGGAQTGSVLVVHGDADPIASYSTDVQLWSTAHPPKAFVDIVHGGHLPPYVDGGAQPDVVRASINDFFDSQLRGDPAGTSRLFVDGNQPGLTSLTTDGIQPNPFGFFDAASAAGNQAVHVVGWAIDPDSDDPDPVSVFIDGRLVTTIGAAASRPDVAAAYPSFSTQHGIDWHVQVDPGPHVVCLTAANVGSGDADAFLGCRTVTVFPEVVGGQAVANADGRLEVFSVRPDHSLAHIWQVAPGASWGSWEGLGGVALAGRVQVATNGDGRLEVFAVGTDGQLWHVWQVCAGCGWSGWFPLGGQWQVDHVTVAANGDGRLELFAVGTDGSLQHEWQPAPSAGWSGWISMGPPWTVGPSAAVAGVAAGSQADGRLVLTTVDPSGRLLVDVQAGPGVGWAAWRALANGGMGGGPPSLGVNEDRRLEVFVVAVNGQLYHSFLAGDGGWTAAAPLGGTFDPAANLAVADNQDQRLEVFGSAPSSHAVTHVWQTQPNSPFGSVVPLGGTGTGLTTASNPDGRIELFAMTLPVAHAWQVGPNAGWSGFFPL
jgi:dienelactone hydrolase